MHISLNRNPSRANLFRQHSLLLAKLPRIQGIGDAAQPIVLEDVIGLQMCTFGPFVPGVHKHEALVSAEKLMGLIELCFDIRSKALRQRPL